MLIMNQNRITSQNGMATLEVLPLLFVFIFLFSYTMGAFGIIHTSIKYSIAARTYAFETFRNRTNLVYFRDKLSSGTTSQYKQTGSRFHGIMGEGNRDSQLVATSRAIQMGMTAKVGASENDPTIHSNTVPTADELSRGRRNQKVEVSPVWIMVVYGICLDVKCGDS
jgi:hypothetical protein